MGSDQVPVGFGSGLGNKNVRTRVFHLGLGFFWVSVTKIHVGFGVGFHFSGSGRVWVAKRSRFWVQVPITKYNSIMYYQKFDQIFGYQILLSKTNKVSDSKISDQHLINF